MEDSTTKAAAFHSGDIRFKRRVVRYPIFAVDLVRVGRTEYRNRTLLSDYFPKAFLRKIWLKIREGKTFDWSQGFRPTHFWALDFRLFLLVDEGINIMALLRFDASVKVFCSKAGGIWGSTGDLLGRGVTVFIFHCLEREGGERLVAESG